ncbi:hypothetical protein INT43_004108 [Umbelopsis isabellina]|uniref:Uncharacterized protein n=1 Tax=Mortierella isabellina TaxID=91625 RepID=A0A8H7PCC5_MORIS|nr:hypothetical protein INT43_004108 [Umbelopsis isabellina]
MTSPQTEILEGISSDLGFTLADAPGKLALLWSLRADEGKDVSVDAIWAMLQLMAIQFVTINGVHMSKTAFDPNSSLLGGFYRTADERTVCFAVNFPHIRDIMCDVLNCPPIKNKISDAVLQWHPVELEEAIGA